MAQSGRKYLEKDSKICGRYVLKKLLKTEAVGITYGAIDQLNHRKVALFEYFPQGMCERDHIFYNQVRVTDYNKSQIYYEGKHAIVECALTMMKFHHEKGILSVLEYMEMNNTVYIVYEYEKGVSLADYISKEGPIPEQDLLAKMDPVIEAVKELHKSGLAHGNITPDTLKVTGEGNILIDDFGGILQNLLPQALKTGKVRYSADPVYDISMLAECIYFGLSGVRPPVRRERESGIRARRLDTFEYPVSGYVADAVDRALSGDRRSGYNSVKEFAAHLHNSVYVKSDEEKKAAARTPVRQKQAAVPAAGRNTKPAGTLQEMLANLEKQRAQQEKERKKQKRTPLRTEKKQKSTKEKKGKKARPFRVLILIYLVYLFFSIIRAAGGLQLPHFSKPDLFRKDYSYEDHQTETEIDISVMTIDGQNYTLPVKLEDFVETGWTVYEDVVSEESLYQFKPLKKDTLTTLILVRNDKRVYLDYQAKEDGLYATSILPQTMGFYGLEENTVSLDGMDLYHISKRELEEYLEVSLGPDDYCMYEDPNGIVMQAFYDDGKLSFFTLGFNDYNPYFPEMTEGQEL